MVLAALIFLISLWVKGDERIVRHSKGDKAVVSDIQDDKSYKAMKDLQFKLGNVMGHDLP